MVKFPFVVLPSLHPGWLSDFGTELEGAELDSTLSEPVE